MNATMGISTGLRRSTTGGLIAMAGLALALAGPAAPAAPVAGAPVSAAPLAAGIAGPDGVRSVVAVSLDGLNPAAIRRLGPAGAPTLHRLIREGASTMNARSSLKRTETLPNHTGMVTGRRIDRRFGGHGIEFNSLRPGTTQRYAGHPVGSVWSVLQHHGEDGGLFVSKDKLVLFKRSWARGVDRYLLRGSNRRLVGAVRRDLAGHDRAFRLVHLSAPDVVGHEHGFMSAAYLGAVRRTDARLGRIVDKIAGSERLREETALIVTADHGGRGRHGHAQARRLVNYRIPFLVWGPGVSGGADLYGLNPDYADPGRRRPGWAADRQPVRNTSVANLALDLLGLPAVPDSIADRDQDLDWR